MCGVGLVLKLDNSHVYELMLGEGLGKNSRWKLLGLFGLLLFANMHKISSLKVFGDSKVIVD